MKYGLWSIGVYNYIQFLILLLVYNHILFIPYFHPNVHALFVYNLYIDNNGRPITE